MPSTALTLVDACLPPSYGSLPSRDYGQSSGVCHETIEDSLPPRWTQGACRMSALPRAAAVLAHWWLRGSQAAASGLHRRSLGGRQHRLMRPAGIATSLVTMRD